MNKLRYYLDKNVISFIILGFATYFIGLTWLSGFLFGSTMGYLFMLNVAKALREKIDGLREELKKVKT